MGASLKGSKKNPLTGQNVVFFVNSDSGAQFYLGIFTHSSQNKCLQISVECYGRHTVCFCEYGLKHPQVFYLWLTF